MTNREYLLEEWTDAEIRTYFRQLKGSTNKKGKSVDGSNISEV